MTQNGYVLLGLTAIVAVLVGVLTFAILKFLVSARDARRRLHQDGAADATLLSAAMQEAVSRLQRQEQAMLARAAASEHLSSQIVESLTAGLLVVDQNGRVEILNRAGRRMLDITTDPIGNDYRKLLSAAAPLENAITECLTTKRPIVRRSLV